MDDQVTQQVNLQDVFDKAVGGVIKQGRKSVLKNTSGICAYRGDYGLKCAVGHIIKDEFYNTGIECKRVHEAPVRSVVCSSLGISLAESADVIALLNGVQLAHDSISLYGGGKEFFTETFKANAKGIADRYGLDWKF